MVIHTHTCTYSLTPNPTTHTIKWGPPPFLVSPVKHVVPPRLIPLILRAYGTDVRTAEKALPDIRCCKYLNRQQRLSFLGGLFLVNFNGLIGTLSRSEEKGDTMRVGLIAFHLCL